MEKLHESAVITLNHFDISRQSFEMVTICDPIVRLWKAQLWWSVSRGVPGTVWSVWDQDQDGFRWIQFLESGIKIYQDTISIHFDMILTSFWPNEKPWSWLIILLIFHDFPSFLWNFHESMKHFPSFSQHVCHESCRSTQILRSSVGAERQLLRSLSKVAPGARVALQSSARLRRTPVWSLGGKHGPQHQQPNFHL